MGTGTQSRVGRDYERRTEKANVSGGGASHISQLAAELRCRHCGSVNIATQGPLKGDYAPFYFQDESGNHAMTMTCSNCGKDWCIVWDADPGPITPLGL